MLLLGIDSTSVSCSAAVLQDGQVFSEIHRNTGTKHSEQLLPVIHQALSLAGLGLGELEGIAVAAGPGSFTGVRIGVSTARALAQSVNLPLMGVGSLEALAENLPVVGPSLVVPLLDARKNEVYAAISRFVAMDLQKPPQQEMLSSPRAIAPRVLFQELQERLERENLQSVYFLGDALEKYAPMIGEILGERGILAPAAAGCIRGAQVARLGGEMLRRERGHNQAAFRDGCYTLEPFYLRKSEAETTWEAKHGG